MRVGRSIPAFVAAVVLAFAGPVAAQRPPSPPGIDQPAATAIAKARDLVKKRRYVEALTVLRPVARQRPVPAQALFLIGIAGIEASAQPGTSEKARDSLLSAAIAALRTMLVRDPTLVRARLELARAFFLKGEDKLARRHFEQVLAGKPPAAVVLNVNRFLTQIRARKRWSVRVGIALAPDSNIGTRSKERTILVDTPFGRLPFTFGEDNAPKSGIGISAWAGGEYQYPLSDAWRLRAGGDISRKEYKASEFDRMTVSGSVGASWVASPTVRTDASIGWGQVRTEREKERNTSRRVALGVEEEDCKRLLRERQRLVKERTALTNAIKGLLKLHGVFDLEPRAADFDVAFAAVTTACGEPFPPQAGQEIERLAERLGLVLRQIEAIEADRDEAVRRAEAERGEADTPPRAAAGSKAQADASIAALARLKGIGANDATLLMHEIFYRQFGNRRELASWAGLTRRPAR